MPDDLFKSGMPGVGSERRKHHARLKAEFSLFPENLVPPGSQATTRRGAPDWCLSSAWRPCGRSIWRLRKTGCAPSPELSSLTGFSLLTGKKTGKIAEMSRQFRLAREDSPHFQGDRCVGQGCITGKSRENPFVCGASSQYSFLSKQSCVEGGTGYSSGSLFLVATQQFDVRQPGNKSRFLFRSSQEIRDG